MCNGKAYVDMIIQTFQRIQAAIFTSSATTAPKTVSEHLRKVLADKFGIDPAGVPEGYLYFPIAFGGLDVKNPFIPLYAIRDNLLTDPDVKISRFLNDEREAYESAKRKFDTDTLIGHDVSSLYGHSRRRTEIGGRYITPEFIKSDAGKEFMSFEEYTRFREQTSSELGSVFKALMMEPIELTVTQTSDVRAADSSRKFDGLRTYDKWIMQLYSGEMIERFGSVQVVERSLLPTGMVMMTRKSRFKWLG